MNIANDPAPAPAAKEPAPVVPSMAELMLRFESIGRNCEFGMVQRCAGAEPLGLFRFAGSMIDSLCTLIETGIADFLGADDIGLTVWGREYMIFSRGLNDFYFHTNIRVDAQEAESVVRREGNKLAYLKKRFELDWKAAARIYVHCGFEDEAGIRRLHAALRKRSDCVLLWVSLARRSEDRGRVEALGPGLLKGHVAHFSTTDDSGMRIDLPGWIMVCRAADALIGGSPPPPPPVPRPIGAAFAWTAVRCGAIARGEGIVRCRILYDCKYATPVAGLTVAARVERRSMVVASLWIRLPPSFRGSLLLLKCASATPINYRCADVAVLGAWQHIWVVMKVAEARDALELSVDVVASRAEIDFGGWQIESGGVPNENLRPSEDAIGPETYDVATVPVPKPPPSTTRMVRSAFLLLRRAADRLCPEPQGSAASEEDKTVMDVLVLSNVLMRERRLDDADAVLLAGMNLYPWRAELYSHFALCGESRDDIRTAAARWEEAACYFPQYALGHYRLAATLRHLRETKRAVAIIEAALPRHLDDVEMLVEAARVFAAAHRWRDAVLQWDRALALAPDKPEWRDARALAAKQAEAEGPGAPS